VYTLKNPAQTPSIRRIDETMFSRRYASDCMGDGCRDDCCRYGCPTDTTEVLRILTFETELEERTGRPAAHWFKRRRCNPDYPSGWVRYTRVFDGYCVFHDHNGRGCVLHRMALEKGLDPHEIKPMVCFFFPLTWDGGLLHVAEFLDELPCRRGDCVIHDAQKTEIAHYLGASAAREIECLAPSARH